MTRTKTPADIGLLLQLLEEAYHRRAWHGPNLRGALRGVPLEVAMYRSRPTGRSIAEITLHCAYWKYAGRRRLLGEKRGSFGIKGSNWFPISRLTAEAWKGHVALLDEMHASLCEAVAGVSQAKLKQAPRGSSTTNLNLIYGLALHDTYHTGQIRMLKAMQSKRKRH